MYSKLGSGELRFLWWRIKTIKQPWKSVHSCFIAWGGVGGISLTGCVYIWAILGCKHPGGGSLSCYAQPFINTHIWTRCLQSFLPTEGFAIPKGLRYWIFCMPMSIFAQDFTHILYILSRHLQLHISDKKYVCWSYSLMKTAPIDFTYIKYMGMGL